MESEDRIAVETTNADFESDPPGYLDNFRDYLSHRTPPALAIGGIVGASIGYYAGDAMALYGYSYGLGLGLVTTSFYSAVYGMRSLRQSDDAVNYAISGFMNGGILGTANGGYRRGIKYSIGGIFGGIVAKYAEDFLFAKARSSWLNYRRLTIEESRPRILEVRPKLRRPKEGEFFSPREVVTLGTDSWPKYDMATKSKSSEHYTTSSETSTAPSKKY